ncbi:SEC-C metal-binding domain-containing protein [Patescibacteria group bacterium]
MSDYEYAPTDSIKMRGTPRGLMPHVTAFCESVAAGQTPLYLQVTPLDGCLVNDCVENVRGRVQSEGGEAVLGWQIWEWYGVLIEAEFHMVWKSSDGELSDITPKELPCDNILFLPDPLLIYEDQQIKNVRKPLLDDQKVTDFVALADAKFKILNDGDRAKQHGAIILSDEEADLFQRVEMQMASCQLAIMHMEPSQNQPCRCGSGEKYMKCCGR